MLKAVSTPTTPPPGARRLRALPTTTDRRLPVAQPESFPDSLNPRLVRFPCPITVQFARPIACGRPFVVSGMLVATMHARGVVHHHRVTVGDVLWLVPPIWLVPSSRLAALRVEPERPDPWVAVFAESFRELGKQWAAKTDEEVAASMQRSGTGA